MAEGRYVPCEAHRKLTTPSAFGEGEFEFQCPIGPPNGIVMSRSYYRVGMTLCGAPNAGVASAPAVQEMIAYADNAVGNLFDKAEVRVNNMTLSKIEQNVPQASALRARLTKSNAWLKSFGSTEMNEANFPKRVNASASTLRTGGYASNPSLKSEDEIYKPVEDGAFNTAVVSVSTFAGTTASFVRGPVGAVTDPVVLADGVANPNSAILLAPALITLSTGSVVTGVGTRFTDRMPGIANGSPSGASVFPGDILVILGIQYPIKAVTNDTTLVLACTIPVAIANTTSWYIIRKDAVRAPQAHNTVYAIYRPPIGIFDCEDTLGCGNYTFHLSPNSRYLNSAVETRNPTALSSIDGKSNDYSLIVNSITFFAYIEKAVIPPSIELTLPEMQLIPLPYEPTMTFSVSPNTTALTFFVQDITAGSNPRVPQSMFKVLDNSDLKLASIQVSFGGTSKPATEIKSNFNNGVDQMQQYFKDSYDQAGLIVEGAETYYDFLQRGPFYHYTFEKDVNNRATEVSVTTNFTGLPDGPGTGAVGGTGKARLFCCAHFRTTKIIESSAGSINVVNTVGA